MSATTTTTTTTVPLAPSNSNAAGLFGTNPNPLDRIAASGTGTAAAGMGIRSRSWANAWLYGPGPAKYVNNRMNRNLRRVGRVKGSVSIASRVTRRRMGIATTGRVQGREPLRVIQGVYRNRYGGAYHQIMITQNTHTLLQQFADDARQAAENPAGQGQQQRTGPYLFPLDGGGSTSTPSGSAPSARTSCPVCLVNEFTYAFRCGHPICRECLPRVANCPQCRGTVNNPVRIFLPY